MIFIKIVTSRPCLTDYSYSQCMNNYSTMNHLTAGFHSLVPGLDLRESISWEAIERDIEPSFESGLLLYNSASYLKGEGAYSDCLETFVKTYTEIFDNMFVIEWHTHEWARNKFSQQKKNSIINRMNDIGQDEMILLPCDLTLYYKGNK